MQYGAIRYKKARRKLSLIKKAHHVRVETRRDALNGCAISSKFMSYGVQFQIEPKSTYLVFYILDCIYRYGLLLPNTLYT